MSSKKPLIISLSAATVVLLLGGGYVTWGVLSANAHNDAWATATESISAEASAASTVELTDDLSVVVFASTASSTCTAAESDATYRKLLDIVVASMGYLPSDWMLRVAGITPEWGAEQCNKDKKIEFERAVSLTRTNVSHFLTAIETPDGVVPSLDVLQGHDGAQTQSFRSPTVGEVKIRVRYDGDDGLAVTITRDQEHLDWGAPFGL